MLYACRRRRPRASNQDIALVHPNRNCAAPYSGLSLGPGSYLYGSAPAFAQPLVLTSSNSFLNVTLTVDTLAVDAGIFRFTTRGYYVTNGISAQVR